MRKTHHIAGISFVAITGACALWFLGHGTQPPNRWSPLSEEELDAIGAHFNMKLLAPPDAATVWFSCSQSAYSLHVRLDFQRSEAGTACVADWFGPTGQGSATQVASDFASPAAGWLATLAVDWQALPVLTSDAWYQHVFPGGEPIQSSGAALFKGGPGGRTLYLVRKGHKHEIPPQLLAVLGKEPVDIGLTPSMAMYMRSGVAPQREKRPRADMKQAPASRPAAGAETGSEK